MLSQKNLPHPRSVSPVSHPVNPTPLQLLTATSGSSSHHLSPFVVVPQHLTRKVQVPKWFQTTKLLMKWSCFQLLMVWIVNYIVVATKSFPRLVFQINLVSVFN